ncbi:MAG: protein-disulfide reductase DsbD domain-containing protein [bacterium]
MNFRLTLLSLLLGLAPVLTAQASPTAHQPHITVKLLSPVSTLQPGQAVTLGVHFKIDQGWHLYWRNPGDSGLAPEFIWHLPKGFHAQSPLWPTPRRLALPSLVDYGYKNEVMFLIPIQVPANAHLGAMVTFSLLTRWLVCDEICIPGRVNLQLKLVVKSKKPGPSRNAKLLTAALKSFPVLWPTDWKTHGVLDSKAFRLTFAVPAQTKSGVFFPLHSNEIENAASQKSRIAGHHLYLDLKRSDQLTTGVQTLEGVIVLKTKKETQGYQVTIPLEVR